MELLEGRLPLSTISSPAAAAGPHVYQNVQHIMLDGQLSGTWSNLPSPPDTGKIQTLNGTGKVSPLGDLQAGGTLHMPGFIASGKTTGEFTLTDNHGSITFRLVAAQSQPGFSDPANKYYFAIEGGTGVYAHSWGGGIALLQERPESHPDWSSNSPHPNFIIAASFTLSLQSYK